MAAGEGAFEQYDLLILGSGQAGNPLSTAFAEAGKRVALIERAEVAGTCINYGCTPTKTMVASAQRAHLARTAGPLGVDVAGVQVDMERVRQRKREIVEQFRHSSEKRFEKGNPELVRGEASFLGPKQILVKLNGGGERRLQAEQIVIDTGTSPSVPKLEGLVSVPFLDNVSLMELGALPEHLVILGGGYIAVEFGQMFRRFGSRVTVIERGPQLLAREDEDVAEALTQILREDGLEILTGAGATAVRGAAGQVAVRLQDGREIAGTHLLVATGRVPNTPGLGLQAAGITVDEHGFVRVNERLETNVPGVYATGDVKGGPAFTHISYDDYRILRANLLEGGDRKTTDRLVPNVVYTDPQLGGVGMTEREARASGRKIKVAKMPFSSVARAIETGETRGLLKVIVDAESQQILGASILGSEGGEIMSMLEIAMMGKLPYPVLQEAVLAHPAYAESLNNVFGHFDEKG